MAADIQPGDYCSKIVDNKYTTHELYEYAYRGALLLKKEQLLKKERMGINNHHANDNYDDGNQMFFKKPKIEEVEDSQPRIEAENQICSTNNFSGSNPTATRDTKATTNMDPNSQKRFENMGSCEMNNSLEDPFQNKRKRIEKRERIKSYISISNSIIDCKLEKGTSVSAHVEKMIGFIESLENLGFPISQELAIGIILGSLSDEYDSFIKDFYGCSLDRTLNELHEMLKSYEITIKKENPTNANLLVEKKKGKKQERRYCKGKEKGQIEKLYKSNLGPQPHRGAKSDDVCNFCNGYGHWKRNCKKYLEDLKK